MKKKTIIKTIALTSLTAVLLAGCQKADKNTLENISSTTTEEIGTNISEDSTDTISEDTGSDGTYYIEDEFDIPDLPIVAKTDTINVAQYEGITIGDYNPGSYDISVTNMILEDKMASYAEEIGEDPDTYVFTEEEISNFSGGECTTYEEFQQYLNDFYNASLQTSYEADKKYAAFYAVVKNSTVDEDSEEWINYYEEQKPDHDELAANYGYDDFDEYADEVYDMTADEFDEMIYEALLDEYKSELLYDYIAEENGFEPDVNNAKEVIQNHADALGITYEECESEYLSEEDVIQNQKVDFVQTLVYEKAIFSK